MPSTIIRQNLRIEGIVQGVGFRPFVYRLAQQRGLSGWVLNDSRGVVVEVEGTAEELALFRTALETENPPLSTISRIQATACQPSGEQEFRIVPSRETDMQTAQVSPDAYVCPDCLAELFNPADRRYGYPFINCTNCGPRYSIVAGVPYDRPLTTMADFRMCGPCQAEYDDPGSRRFHAQPNACPDCGPQLALHDASGNRLGAKEPLAVAVIALKEGQVVAIKGLGGYHLVVDPANPAAVERLRQRKKRDEKPFALMSADLKSAGRFVLVGEIEARLLESVERPIVLLEKMGHQPLVCEQVAPGNRYFGVMLPYTPLHYLLMEHFPALVMTSGNQSDEPIAFDEEDAFSRLEGIADLFLVHDRRIHIRTDDSIVRILDSQPVILRRSRGYVPRAVKLPKRQPPVLAVGAELKNCICLTSEDRATLSHHIGDLKNQTVLESLAQAGKHLQQLLGVEPRLVAHDLHPDYLSTQAARQWEGVQRTAVQHHHAHLASCLADNGRDGTAIGVIFDGIGYGTDGHIWGGEFLLGNFREFERLGHLEEMLMPGGDAATREPWRMACSLLFAACGPAQMPQLDFMREVPAGDRKLLLQMLEKGLNSPPTSSCGRLFDAVAALCGTRLKVSYEGQAALELEMAIDHEAKVKPYPMPLVENGAGFCLEYRALVASLVADLRAGTGIGAISKAFHLGLAQGIFAACRHIRKQRGKLPVALSGGVFQNAYLTEKVAELLRQDDFEVLLHRQVPPNDGGLALGQAVIAGNRL